MRPIDRPGLENHSKRAFKDYTLWAEELIEYFGPYCAYCEAVLPSSLSIDHRFPQTRAEKTTFAVNDWENLLPSCSSCNGSKSAKMEDVSDLANYYWPDAHNTFLLFKYDQEGKVSVNVQRIREYIDLLELSGDAKKKLQSVHGRQEVIQRAIEKAANTIEMLDLNSVGGRFKWNDLRVQSRRRVWDVATSAADLYAQSGADQKTKVAGYILGSAKAVGFWSVWLTVLSQKNNNGNLEPLIQTKIDPGRPPDTPGWLPGTAAADDKGGVPIVGFANGAFSFKPHRSLGLWEWKGSITGLGTSTASSNKSGKGQKNNTNDRPPRVTRSRSRSMSQLPLGDANAVLNPGIDSLTQTENQVLRH